jgi:hypothetical protein
MSNNASAEKPERAPAADDRKQGNRLDLISAVVLGVSALATAYASYQAELWDGEQAAHYTKANALRVEASRVSLRAGQLEAADLMTFGAWLSAHAAEETELENFYVKRFRPEFARVFGIWAATRPRFNPDAPPTPFVMPEYDLKERKAADELEQKAHDLFAAGENANKKGDQFVLATVILANALFFGGINQLPNSKRTRKVLLGLAVAFCVLGVGYIALLAPAP